MANIKNLTYLSMEADPIPLQSDPLALSCGATLISRLGCSLIELLFSIL